MVFNHSLPEEIILELDGLGLFANQGWSMERGFIGRLPPPEGSIWAGLSFHRAGGGRKAQTIGFKSKLNVGKKAKEGADEP